MSSFPDSLTDPELFAVNEILASIGQAPVVNLNTANPDTAIALNTLRSTNREVQAEGWAFNLENEYSFSPDNDGNILVPANILMLDVTKYLPENYGQSVVVREGKLYNKIEHTFMWDEALLCDVLWLIPFSDTPAVFQNFVTAKAAVVASTRMVGGDKVMYAMLKDKEASAKASVMQYECQQSNPNMLGFDPGQNRYTSYEPFHALIR